MVSSTFHRKMVLNGTSQDLVEHRSVPWPPRNGSGAPNPFTTHNFNKLVLRNASISGLNESVNAHGFEAHVRRAGGLDPVGKGNLNRVPPNYARHRNMTSGHGMHNSNGSLALRGKNARSDDEGTTRIMEPIVPKSKNLTMIPGPTITVTSTTGTTTMSTSLVYEQDLATPTVVSPIDSDLSVDEDSYKEFMQRWRGPEGLAADANFQAAGYTPTPRKEKLAPEETDVIVFVDGAPKPGEQSTSWTWSLYEPQTTVTTTVVVPSTETGSATRSALESHRKALIFMKKREPNVQAAKPTPTPLKLKPLPGETDTIVVKDGGPKPGEQSTYWTWKSTSYGSERLMAVPRTPTASSTPAAPSTLEQHRKALAFMNKRFPIKNNLTAAVTPGVQRNVSFVQEVRTLTKNKRREALSLVGTPFTYTPKQSWRNTKTTSEPYSSLESRHAQKPTIRSAMILLPGQPEDGDDESTDSDSEIKLIYTTADMPFNYPKPSVIETVFIIPRHATATIQTGLHERGSQTTSTVYDLLESHGPEKPTIRSAMILLPGQPEDGDDESTDSDSEIKLIYTTEEMPFNYPKPTVIETVFIIPRHANATLPAGLDKRATQTIGTVVTTEPVRLSTPTNDSESDSDTEKESIDKVSWMKTHGSLSLPPPMTVTVFASTAGRGTYLISSTTPCSVCPEPDSDSEDEKSGSKKAKQTKAASLPRSLQQRSPPKPSTISISNAKDSDSDDSDKSDDSDSDLPPDTTIWVGHKLMPHPHTVDERGLLEAVGEMHAAMTATDESRLADKTVLGLATQTPGRGDGKVVVARATEGVAATAAAPTLPVSSEMAASADRAAIYTRFWCAVIGGTIGSLILVCLTIIYVVRLGAKKRERLAREARMEKKWPVGPAGEQVWSVRIDGRRVD